MKKMVFLAAATIALAACNNEDNYIDEPIAALISATIGDNAVTRASNTSWANGDKIGVTMNVDDVDRYVNLRYTTESGDGNFSGTTMYFKNRREPVTMTAYYPFAGNENEVPVVEASTTTEKQKTENQPTIDFLFARTEGVKGESNPQPVEFKFLHKMGKLTFIFKNGNGMDVSTIRSYTIEGLVLSGTFNTVTGVCAAKKNTDAKSISKDLESVTPGEMVASVIVFPQTPADKTVTLKIKDGDNQEYTCTLSFGEDGIVSGNNYQFTITVNKTGLSVNNSIIGEWAPKDMGSTDANEK